MIKYFIFIICSMLSFQALSRDYPFRGCFIAASKKYNIDIDLIASIAKIESNFQPKAINKNSNGSLDIGIMQINSWWLSKKTPFNFTKDDLFHDTCLNVMIGSWILSENFRLNGVTWESVGAYNAGFSKSSSRSLLRYNYSSKVYDSYREYKN